MKLSREMSKIIGRIEDRDEKGYHIFSNPSRREIFQELTRAPAQTSSSVAKKLGVDVQNVEWHLGKLSREGFVGSVEINKKLYYPIGLMRVEDAPLFQLLNTKGGWIVVNSLIGRCRDMKFLHRHISQSTAYRVVNALKSMGVVEVHKGSKRLICLNDRFKDLREEYEKMGFEFKRDFLKRIEIRGYSVEVIGTYGYETKIRVSGMENFTLGIYISPLRTILEVRR